MSRLIHWDYFKNLNDINAMIASAHQYSDELSSADQIISITFDTNQGAYVVFWKDKNAETTQNHEQEDNSSDKCLSCTKWSYSHDDCMLSFPYNRHCKTNEFCYYSNQSL